MARGIWKGTLGFGLVNIGVACSNSATSPAMDHPGIARIYNAGTTEDGRLFFAMELVRGIPITGYCDQNRLGLRERLGLFVQVCSALHHAHPKRVVHRDMKPSNVLVIAHAENGSLPRARTTTGAFSVDGVVVSDQPRGSRHDTLRKKESPELSGPSRILRHDGSWKSDDYIKGIPAVPGGPLTSKPTWSCTKGCRLMSAFFFGGAG